MAEIAPLTPLRYDLSKLPAGLASVVAPPYDVIDAREREELARRDPHNVVRLILPEGDGDTKYARAAELLSAWRREGVLARDDQPAFYRYDQTFTAPGDATRTFTRRGFLALVRLVPFSERVVLPHERTLSGPKEDRLRLFRATRTNLSPGFQLYSDPEQRLAPALETGEVLAEFATADGVRHALAKVSDRDAVQAITSHVARSTLLIADGHHRYETALTYMREVDAAGGSAHPRGAHRYFMTFLANGDDPNLVVFPTHRHVHDLAASAPFTWSSLREKTRGTFVVEDLPGDADPAAYLERLAAAGASGPAFVAVTAKAAALVTLAKGADLAAHPTLAGVHAELRTTDVALLHSGVLEHALGITREAQAAKTNLWYPQDARASIAEIRQGRGDVLFLMNATPVRDVRRVAEAGEVMPQKSTFFYPKVMTGLAIHTLEPERAV